MSVKSIGVIYEAPPFLSIRPFLCGRSLYNARTDTPCWICFSTSKKQNKALETWTELRIAHQCQPIWPGPSATLFAAVYPLELLRLFIPAGRVVRIMLETRPGRKRLRGPPRF